MGLLEPGNESFIAPRPMKRLNKLVVLVRVV